MRRKRIEATRLTQAMAEEFVREMARRGLDFDCFECTRCAAWHVESEHHAPACRRHLRWPPFVPPERSLTTRL
jgi:hypothetical protein